jgi:hypothetical protein
MQCWRSQDQEKKGECEGIQRVEVGKVALTLFNQLVEEVVSLSPPLFVGVLDFLDFEILSIFTT